MRVVLAGLFVLGALCCAAVVLSDPLEDWLPEWAAMLVLLFVCFAVLVGACVLFNLGDKGQPEPYLSLEEMRASGLVAHEEFQATRALQVEETEDEGPTFFLALEDGRVLFLCGQYLYDLDPTEVNQEGLFPNTRFLVHRHAESGYALSIEPLGAPFEPEAFAPAFSFADWQADQVPQDGDILDEPLDQIKQRLGAQ